ncbi:alpha-hydroxy acid oxidase [Microbacterium memoriense]|uniref:Alpha-hydroxy-acid oxidizing protein n=1 Tax=Microbacterium memoriense TaxID=2978350 RepID=A0ABT2P921_9MICO|nr:alpha-hydroxy acid oxidase [Microbacterium memoriense]MCT9001045.1 alpha-hydroxy-acid oxidizing protein [Microbacterium memoriense]
MKLSEAFQFIGLTRGRATGAYSHLHTIGDVHRAALRALPRGISDYVDGGADTETTLEANRAAFNRLRWQPDSLVPADVVDTSKTLAGDKWAMPIGLAPTGYTRMIHPAGEIGVAEAAAAAGVPYVLSTVATTTIEDVAAASTAPWSQLYTMRDRDVTNDLIRRADAAGSPVLEVAVDTAVAGNRVRDRRNGLIIPPRMTLATLGGIAVKPRYWSSMLANESFDFVQVKKSVRSGTLPGGSIADITAGFDAALDWDEIARIRKLWPRTLLLKGPIGPHDAVRAQELGVDGVHLSNHGGRQLDRVIAPIELTGPVRAALGRDALVVVDSGVRNGGDVAFALALGADAAFIGRPYIWGLAAGGGDGVARVLAILHAELARTMALVGAPSIAALRDRGPRLIAQRGSENT